MKYNLIILLLTLLLCEVFASNQTEPETNSTLELIHVIFRHGDRTPDLYCIEYGILPPNETYKPEGYGALTKLGKQQEYNIGVALRERYGEWLGDVYYPEIQAARSTDTPRTKMSLQLVLAGLWPPAVEQTWNWDLNWQPVPFDVVEKSKDKLMGYPPNCPNFLVEYEKVLSSPKVRNIIKTKQRLINYVMKHTNPTTESRPVEYMFGVFFCLYAMEKMGTPLPEWSRPIYPDALEKLPILEYLLKTYNGTLQQYTGGQFLKEVLDNSQAKVTNQLEPEERKLFLYSGHEYNIAHILRALNAYTPHLPPYGAYIIFELHKVREIYGFKIFYQNYKNKDPMPIIVPGCDVFCPVHDFVQLLINYLPGPGIECT